MSRRNVRADILLVRNIRALLDTRGIEDQALAMWCGHRRAWLSKILSGERGIQIKELGKIADFFGLTVSDLFQYGIAAMNDRRRRERRSPVDRRTGADRRHHQVGSLHPDVIAQFKRISTMRLSDGTEDTDEH